MRRFSEADLPDLTGKTALVTGANTGLGFETARLLAEKGARVLIACRNKEKGIAAAERINQRLVQSRAVFVPLDLANLSSVRDVVGHVEREASLDILINNAGVMATPRMLTADGFELQFGVNHLGHFALTATLWPLLAQSPSPRVVTVSSLTHWLGRIDFDDLDGEQRYRPMGRYEMSKLANLMFTFELASRAESVGSPLVATACHPGASSTDLARDHPILNALFVPMAYVLNTARQGALPTLRAATDAYANSGDYFGPEGLLQLARGAKSVGVSQSARDPVLRRRLWEVSERLTGCKFLS